MPRKRWQGIFDQIHANPAFIGGWRQISSPASRDQRPNRLAAFAGCLREVFLQLALFTVAFLCLGQWVFLGDDHWPKFGVFAVEFNPLFHVWLCVGADRIRRAFRLANAAIDTFIGMNDQHVLAFIKAIHRTYFNAVGVFAGDTGIVNDIGHNIIFYGRFNPRDTSA